MKTDLERFGQGKTLTRLLNEAAGHSRSLFSVISVSSVASVFSVLILFLLRVPLRLCELCVNSVSLECRPLSRMKAPV
jgi:hypothetical protein